jgi:uncharacterized protein (UPF0332 family)
LTWSRGKAVIERLLEAGELERIPLNQELVDLLLAESEEHLGSVEVIGSNDATGAYQLAYDAVRKAATALLAAQGLRPKSAGGHVAVQEAMEAQFGGGASRAFRSFNRLRRQRNDLEYPDDAGPRVDADDVADALRTARADLEFANQILDSGKLSVFAG